MSDPKNEYLDANGSGLGWYSRFDKESGRARRAHRPGVVLVPVVVVAAAVWRMVRVAVDRVAVR